MATKDARTQTASDRGDLWTAMIIAALVIGWLVYDAGRSLTQMFSTPGAVSVAAPVPPQEITAALGDGVAATVDSAQLVVPGVNIVSVICLVLAIALPAWALVGVAVTSAALCLRLLRGVVFDSINTWLAFWISMTLLVAGALGAWFQNMGLSGVYTALRVSFDDFTWRLVSNTAPSVVAGVAAGVLVIVFRRGTALQKDAEGLV